MTHVFDTEALPDFAPLTAGENDRLKALFDGVSTRTLLYALLGLGRDSDDARLIIAVILGRLPVGTL